MYKLQCTVCPCDVYHWPKWIEKMSFSERCMDPRLKYHVGKADFDNDGVLLSMDRNKVTFSSNSFVQIVEIMPPWNYWFFFFFFDNTLKLLVLVKIT